MGNTDEHTCAFIGRYNSLNVTYCSFVELNIYTTFTEDSYTIILTKCCFCWYITSTKSVDSSYCWFL